MAVGHNTLHTAFKSLLKNVFGTKENAELFWLLLQVLVSVEEPASVENATLRYASLRSGGET